MISTALVANGATVYIIGLEQAQLDKIAALFNEGAAKVKGGGRLIGLQGDIRLKVSFTRATSSCKGS